MYVGDYRLFNLLGRDKDDLAFAEIDDQNAFKMNSDGHELRKIKT